MAEDNDTVFVVTFIESERGWGQSEFYNFYDSLEDAEKARDECNKSNEDDYERTNIIPDYYIQANKVIRAMRRSEALIICK